MAILAKPDGIVTKRRAGGPRAWLAGVVLALAVSGCANVLTARITSFHAMDERVGAPLTYVFAPTAEQADNLEYAAYERLVADALLRRGFTRVDAAKAAYKVHFSYALGESVVRVVEPSFYGPPIYGPAYFGPYWGPYYGPHRPFMRPVVPMYPSYVERGYPVSQYTFALELRDVKTGKRVYQVNVEAGHEGAVPSMATVVQAMADAALDDFPGTNGEARTVRIKLPPSR